MSLSRRLGCIGVDVGTHTVKLAQAERTPGGVRLHCAAVVQRPAAWASGDQLAWDQPLTSAPEIQAALGWGGFSGRDAVCVLPMNVCQLRGLNVPPGTDAERRAMITEELLEEWSERGREMGFDFWELESDGANKSQEQFTVEVLSATRGWITQLTQDCQRAGLECWALDGVPLAMARAVGLVGGLSGGRHALAVDWGFSNTTLCMVGDHRPLYARRIHSCGFGQVLEAIRQVLGVTLDESQHLVDTVGLAGNDDPHNPDVETRTTITDAAAGTLETLTREIHRTLQFVEGQRHHLQPVSVWLLGGGASMRNLASYLAQLLPLPVKAWSVAADEERMPFAAGRRSAMFAGAVALSAQKWRAA